jgi:hypothetical protein
MSHRDKVVTGAKPNVAALSARFESMALTNVCREQPTGPFRGGAGGHGFPSESPVSPIAKTLSHSAFMRAALGAKSDGERSPVSLDECHLPSTRPLSFGQFQGCQDTADAHDSSQSTSRHSSQWYQAFLDAKTKMDAVGAMNNYLRIGWRVPSSKDESAPGPVYVTSSMLLSSTV